MNKTLIGSLILIPLLVGYGGTYAEDLLWRMNENAGARPFNLLGGTMKLGMAGYLALGLTTDIGILFIFTRLSEAEPGEEETRRTEREKKSCAGCGKEKTPVFMVYEVPPSKKPLFPDGEKETRLLLVSRFPLSFKNVADICSEKCLQKLVKECGQRSLTIEPTTDLGGQVILDGKKVGTEKMKK